MRIKTVQLVGLLSAALMIASAPAISANIPSISNSFPAVPEIYISLFTTIPSLFLILGVFLTDIIELVLGKKKTILLGLLMVGVFGSLPVWYSQSFWLMFLSRCLLGMGIGLFNRLIIQMISLLYQSDVKKARVLGLESAFEGLGGIMMTFTVGQLVKVSWQSSFIVYCLAFLGFILIFLFVPETGKADQDMKVEKVSLIVPKSSKKKMIQMSCLLFVIVSFFIIYNLQITPLLIEKRIGNATEGSNMIAAIAIGAFIAGNLFGKTYAWLKNYLLPIATLAAAIFIFITTISSSVIVTMICSAGLGFSFRNIMPLFNHLFTSGDEASGKFGTTVILVAYNLGSTLAPYMIKLITSISNNVTPTSLILVVAMGFALISCGTLIFNQKVRLVDSVH